MGASSTSRPSPRRDATRYIPAIDDEKLALWEQVEDHDDATLERDRELWEEERGGRVLAATMGCALRKCSPWVEVPTSRPAS